MRVIVSNVLSNKYRGYTVIPQIADAKELSDIEVLIIHRLDDTDIKIGTAMSELSKRGIKKFLYITEEPSSLVKMLIDGVGGSCFTDEFYFDEEEDLDAIVDEVLNSPQTSTSLVTTDNSSIIRDFIESFARGEEHIKSPAYLEQVNDAVTEMTVQLESYSLATQDMSNKVFEVFNKVSGLVKNFEQTTRELQDVTNKLNMTKETTSQRSSGFNGSINSFTTVKLFGSSKIIVFHELSPCRYLTSFVLGYYKYLKDAKNKRVKLIVCASRAKRVADKYGEFTSINDATRNMTSLYSQDMLYISYPIKDVISKAIDGSKEVYIILDRLYGEYPIVEQPTGYTRITALSGMTDLRNFGAKLEDSIFSVNEVAGAFYTIPAYMNYPTERIARYSHYIQTQSDIYKKIDERVRL